MARHEDRGLRILALDGGGVRGLSELLILRQLMPLVEEESDPSDGMLDRPCEVFDIICGTSTGGLIAILLGRLGLTVKEAIKEYETLFFGEPKQPMPGRETKYSVAIFEKKIKRLIAEYAGDENVAMLEESGKCKVFVCTQRAQHMDTPFLMRTYADPTMVDDLAIWQAARATSAAPTFFKSLTIGNHEYVEGGLGYNNPCKALFTELERTYRKEPDQTISCIVNIGTGIPRVMQVKRPKGFGIKWLLDVVNALEGVATACEVTAEEMALRFQSIPNFYFRFNVEQGMQGVDMDMYEELGAIIAHAEVYLDQKRVRDLLLQAAKALSSRLPGPLRVYDLNLSVGTVPYQTTDSPHLFYLSSFPPQTPHFFGRDRELNSIHRILGSEPICKKVMVLWGFPGSGKTVTALGYAERFKHDYKFVLWINASSQTTAEASFSEVRLRMMNSSENNVQTETPGLQDILYVKKWLEAGPKNWLMILDSVDDLNVDIQAILPKCEHGAILMTSSRSNLGISLDMEHLEVEKIDEKSGTSILLAWANIGPASDHMQEEATKIVTTLYGLPLAFEQAGAFLNKGLPLGEFRKLLSDNVSSVMSRKPERSEWTYDKNRGLYAILEILPAQLARKEATAPAVLLWISLLGPGSVFINALQPELGIATFLEVWTEFVKAIQNAPQICNHLTRVAGSVDIFGSAVSELEDSCILKTRRGSNGAKISVSLHITVRQWVMDGVDHQDRGEEATWA